MSNILFPTGDDRAPVEVSAQENLEGVQNDPMEPITTEDKIIRLIITTSVGLLLGAFESVFGIALILLALVLAWRIWVSHAGSPISRFTLLFLSAVVFVCGILCFVVDSRQVAQKTAAQKAPFFAFIAMALAFALTFAFTEFINLGICNLCCPITFYNNPTFISRVQMYIVLGAGVLLGMILGIIFGQLAVEEDANDGHQKLVRLLLYGLIPGFLIGGGMGFLTEFLRDKLPQAAYAPLPVERPANEPRGMPSGYDDI